MMKIVTLKMWLTFEYRLFSHPNGRYLPDWDDRCTHLVCAFANTPKWSQVAQTGGRIVTKEWLDACEQAGRQILWRDFKCGKYRDKVSRDKCKSYSRL